MDTIHYLGPCTVTELTLSLYHDALNDRQMPLYLQPGHRWTAYQKAFSAGLSFTLLTPSMWQTRATCRHKANPFSPAAWLPSESWKPSTHCASLSCSYRWLCNPVLIHGMSVGDSWQEFYLPDQRGLTIASRATPLPPALEADEWRCLYWWWLYKNAYIHS